METKRQKCRVIMLPTEDKPTNGLQPISNYSKPLNKGNIRVCSSGAEARRMVELGCQAYHLYIISEDKIDSNNNDIYMYIDLQGRALFPVTPTADAYTSHDAIDRKIIASTDSTLGLPKPSKAFIEKYCKVGGIDEIDVEYFLQDIFLKPRQKEYWCPAVNNGEITIHPIKDSWNREEVEVLLLQCAEFWGVSSKQDYEEHNTWIENNL